MVFVISILKLLKQSAIRWTDDNASSKGAALAYYTTFSIAPLLIIAIAIAGLIFGQEAARGGLFRELNTLFGAEASTAIEAMLKNAYKPDEAIFSVIVSTLTLLIGATTVFVELQSSLDTIWKAEPRPGSGIVNFIKTRLISIGMILAIGFLLIVSLMMSVFIAALANVWSGWLSNVEWLLQIINFAVWFGVITLLFAMIYKYLPNVKIAWEDVWIGASVTSLLFAGGKLLIGLYIGKSALSSSFGAAGAFVVLIVWIYYSAQIFLFGAEFTYQYAHERGSLAETKKK